MKLYIIKIYMENKNKKHLRAHTVHHLIPLTLIDQQNIYSSQVFLW